MSLFSKLFGGGGGGAAPEAESTTYEGFKITPNPAREGSRFRIGALIEKGENSHQLIRADMLESLDEANDASVRKAKQMIDEQGERLFT
ncbi:MAG: HlyU family transcriptional regulator [Pseudomonadota bacterium]